MTKPNQQPGGQDDASEHLNLFNTELHNLEGAEHPPSQSDGCEQVVTIADLPDFPARQSTGPELAESAARSAACATESGISNDLANPFNIELHELEGVDSSKFRYEGDDRVVTVADLPDFPKVEPEIK